MNIPFEIFKNYAIKVPIIKYAGKLLHKTGIGNDQKLINSRADFMYEKLLALRVGEIGAIVEVGPGKTTDLLLEISKKLNSTYVVANDSEDYFDDVFWELKNIKFVRANQDNNFLEANCFDFIYSYDVLEHVRNPKDFIIGIRRALKKGGIFFASWDLRDHFHLPNEHLWFEMHQYSEKIWRLMTINRSNYSNRFFFKDWVTIFEENKFEVIEISTKHSKIAADYFFKKNANSIDDVYRVEAFFRAI
jgi:SAM-dependent methyltransferase